MVAVDSDPHAAGLPHADVAAVADIDAADDVEELAARHAVGGVLTVAADRTVAVVATVTERLGLPSIGPDTAPSGSDIEKRSVAEEAIASCAMKATPSIGEMSIAVLVSKIAAIGPIGVPTPVDGSAY